jgi:hypothetical protein
VDLSGAKHEMAIRAFAATLGSCRQGGEDKREVIRRLVEFGRKVKK